MKTRIRKPLLFLLTLCMALSLSVPVMAKGGVVESEAALGEAIEIISDDEMASKQAPASYDSTEVLNEVQSESDATDITFTAEEKQRIRELKHSYSLILEQQPFNVYEALFTVIPKVDGSPYNPGQTTEQYKKYAQDYINFIRSFNDLPETTISPERTLMAQSAAAALASVDQGLSHYIVDNFQKPEWIPEEEWIFADQGTRTSNIAYKYSSSEREFIRQPIDAFMQDAGANNTSVGHRSWILDYNLTTFGMGGAEAALNQWHKVYTAIKVFDNSSSSKKNPTGWTAEWPSKGVFPINYLSNDFRWSAHFTRSDYDFTEDLKVVLKNNNTGDTWEFSNEYADGEFKMITENYGYYKTIMFNPSGISYQVNDSFTVNITGLKGTKTSYEYTVKLFDLDEEVQKTFYDYFPDPKLAEGVANNINMTADQIVTEERLQDVTALSLVGKDIQSIEGIEILSKLSYLDVTNNKLTSLPDSLFKLSNLSYLKISSNRFTSLTELIGKR